MVPITEKCLQRAKIKGKTKKGTHDQFPKRSLGTSEGNLRFPQEPWKEIKEIKGREPLIPGTKQTRGENPLNLRKIPKKEFLTRGKPSPQKRKPKKK